MSAAGSPTEAPAVHTPPPRGLRNVVVTLLVITLASGWIGNAFAPALVAHHPLALIALNPSNRYLVLGGIRTGWGPYLAIASVRRMLPVVLYFVLGRWYGERAIRWLEHRSPDEGGLVRQIEGWFTRAAWPIIVVMPIGTVGLLAGAAGMATSAVLGVMTISIVARVVALRLVGHAFSGPVDHLVGWIDRARGPLLVFTIGAAAIMLFSERKRRRESLDELTALGDDES